MPESPASLAMRRRMPPLPTGRELRFVVVGGFNTVFGLATFAFFHAVLGDTLPYLLLLVPTYAVGIVVSFATQRTFVFRVKGRVWTDLTRFTVVQLGALVLNAVALPVVREGTDLPVVASQAIALAVVATVTYFSHLHFSFHRHKDAA